MHKSFNPLIYATENSQGLYVYVSYARLSPNFRIFVQAVIV